MNDLQIFRNAEFGELTLLEINNEPWFVGKEVAEKLGYENGSRDINRHVSEEDRRIIQNYQNGTFEIPNRGLTIINESGLYSLILGSKLESAIAKDYGLSGKALNKILHELGIQFNQGGVWLLYAKYQDKGYTSTKTTVFPRTDGTQGLSILTKWTQKGRLFLYDILKANGYIPLVWTLRSQ